MRNQRLQAICLQHVAFEGPGVFAAALAGRGVRLEPVLVPRDGLPQAPGDLLIVMGGPMSVNDADRWIAEETEFIRSALVNGTPVLGVCLGSQFMAKALGANVASGPAIEVGMTRIELTEEGKYDPVFKTCSDRFEVFEWHGEIFDLPAGCVALAGSAAAPFQAFRYGERAYGLLFHLELERHGIEALCRECAPDLVRAGLSAERVLADAAPHLPVLHRLAHRLVEHLTRPH